MMAKTKTLKAKPKTRDSYKSSKPTTESKRRSKSRRLSIGSDTDPGRLVRGPLLTVRLSVPDEVEQDDGPVEVPATEEEFREQYKRYAKLQVIDPATEENIFGDPIRVNDFVQIRAGEVGGQSVEESENWYGQVVAIGAKKESDAEQPEVCLRVAWFYDYKMIQQQMLSVEDRKACAKMLENELLSSDHQDTVHILSLMGRVNITYFDEYSTSQVEIESDDLFYRRKLQIGSNRLIMARDTCTVRCKAPYNPTRDIQHFCPRDKCGRWYHLSCMAPSRSHQDDFRLLGYRRPPEEKLLLNLVMNSELKSKRPSPSDKVNLKASPFAFNNPSSETEAETEASTASPDPPPAATQRALTLARQLPPQIRTLATSAITRGIGSGNGIVGNAWAVLRARELARQVIVDEKSLTPEEELEFAEAVAGMNSEDGPKLTPMAYECQGCGFPI